MAELPRGDTAHRRKTKPSHGMVSRGSNSDPAQGVSFLPERALYPRMQMARKGRLLVCFVGTCKQCLAIRRGMFGLERDFCSGNRAYQRAME
eukprot:3571662-Lingulodinium_polyedra.AAC.1